MKEITKENLKVKIFENRSLMGSAAAEAVAVGEDITTVIWHYDYTHREWGIRNYKQVSVQHWKNGKIVKEQFFYGN